MNLFSRNKNTAVLATVLLIQLLALVVQVRRQTPEGPVQALRLLAVDTVAAFERALLHTRGAERGVWTNYIDLRHVRRENQRLEAESERMRLERAREQEEIRQAPRIQALLGFKQQKARAPDTTGLGSVRASDILAEHLPAVPTAAPAAAPATAAPGTTPPGMAPPGMASAAPKTAVPGVAPPGAAPATRKAASPGAGQSGAAPAA